MNLIEIKNWLEKYNIKNYEIIEDTKYGYIINVNESVNLFGCILGKLPLKFNIINGSFDCSMNRLDNLKNCPEIVKGDFNASTNNIKNLKFFPKEIHGNCNLTINILKNLKGLNLVKKSIYLSNNSLKSLIGLQEEVNGDLILSNNNLKSLKWCSTIIKGDFYCDQNYLKDLNFFPTYIENDIGISLNGIKKINQIQKVVNGSLDVNFNKIKDLSTFPDEIKKDLDCYGNDIDIYCLKKIPKKIDGEIHFENIYSNKNQKIKNFDDLEKIHKNYLLKIKLEKKINSNNIKKINKI